MAPIHDFAKAGNVTGVRRELASGVSPNCINEEEATPLHTAAASPHSQWHLVHAADRLAAQFQILSLLVENGADPNARDYMHWTPLTVAVINHNIDGVALLLAAGASPSPKSDSGMMALEYGAMINARRRRVISMLIRAGAQLPRASHAEWMRESNNGNGFEHAQAARRYVAKIAAAGSWAAYEKAHTTRLVTVFEKVFPRPRLPHEIASHVVRFCFHTGDY